MQRLFGSVMELVEDEDTFVVVLIGTSVIVAEVLASADIDQMRLNPSRLPGLALWQAMSPRMRCG